MLVRSKCFSQFVEKIEKLGLSKQFSTMLKIRLEMLKIRKNGKIIKSGKTRVKQLCRKILNNTHGEENQCFNKKLQTK